MRNLLKHAFMIGIFVTTSIIAGEYKNVPAHLVTQQEVIDASMTTPAEEFTPYFDYFNSAFGKSNIKFELKKPGYVNIRIYDDAGNTVDELLKSTFGAGIHEISWNSSMFPSGKYYYSIITSEFSITKKLN